MSKYENHNSGPIEILVAEDSPTQAERLRYFLEKNGYAVTVVGDGCAAVQAVRLSKPALIISDVVMPEMDGYSLCKHVKGDEGLRDIPVILVTDLSRADDVISGLECGADNFIRKPYQEKDLLQRIRYLLTNGAIRKSSKLKMGIEVDLRGKRHFVTAERQQILDLLISMYEDAAGLTENLEHSLQSLKAVYGVAEALSHCISEVDIVRKVVDLVIEFPGISAAWIYLLEPDETFQCGASRGLPPALFEGDAAKELCVCQQLMLEGALLHSRNVIECEKLKRGNLETWGLSLHASVPLSASDKSLGVLNLAGEGVELLSNEDHRVLQGVGNLVGIALERARIHADLRRLVDERTTALHESEAWFHGVFTAQEDAVFVISSERTIIDANPAAQRILGYSLSEMEGVSTEMLHVDHDHFTHFGERIQQAFVSGESTKLEFELRRKNGEVFPTEHTVSQLKNPTGDMLGIVSVFRDITQRKHAEAERNRLVAILENTPDLVGIVNVNYRVVYVNAAGRAMLGMGHGNDIAGFPIENAHPEDARSLLFDEAIPSAMRDGVWIGETVMCNRDGIRFPVSQEIIAHKDREGNIEFLSTIARDLTERKRAEAKLKNLEEQYHQAQRMESIGMLAGGIAHDMNNILSVVMGYTELATASLEPGTELHEDLVRVKEAGERGTRLVKQILAFGRRQVLDPQILDINVVIQEFEKLIGRLIGEDIEFRTVLADDLEAVLVDDAQIEQVLMNLAINARDAMPDGGRLTIETANVHLDEHYTANRFEVKRGDYVLVTISDTGQGMDAETQRRIFDPFFTTKGPEKGTGLGLATVYGIVKQHDGYIYVYSELGHGTTFKIYLPAAERVKRPQAPKVHFPSLPSGSETVLIVEDDAAILKLANNILSRHGYSVCQAESPEAAIKWVESTKENIDLVLTDVIMPGMNGRDLVNRLREIRPGLRALFFSGYTHDTISRHGILDEGIVYLAKPFTIQSLLEKVRQALS